MESIKLAAPIVQRLQTIEKERQEALSSIEKQKSDLFNVICQSIVAQLGDAQYQYKLNDDFTELIPVQPEEA